MRDGVGSEELEWTGMGWDRRGWEGRELNGVDVYTRELVRGRGVRVFKGLLGRDVEVREEEGEEGEGGGWGWSSVDGEI